MEPSRNSSWGGDGSPGPPLVLAQERVAPGRRDRAGQVDGVGHPERRGGRGRLRRRSWVGRRGLRGSRSRGGSSGGSGGGGFGRGGWSRGRGRDRWSIGNPSHRRGHGGRAGRRLRGATSAGRQHRNCEGDESPVLQITADRHGQRVSVPRGITRSLTLRGGRGGWHRTCGDPDGLGIDIGAAWLIQASLRIDESLDVDAALRAVAPAQPGESTRPCAQGSAVAATATSPAGSTLVIRVLARRRRSGPAARPRRAQPRRNGRPRGRAVPRSA